MIGHIWAQDLLRRAAARHSLGHAYLLAGPTSVGKTALALFVGGLLVCTELEPRPCGACRACRNLAHGRHPDVRVIERAAERRDMTIDQIRQLEGEIVLAPYEASSKLFCLADADTLNDAAASALLKTLEEPPPHAMLLLTATDSTALPITIRSRCQQLTLQPVAAKTIAEGLVIQHAIAPDRAAELAALARGRPGWAVRALADTGLIEQERAAVAAVTRLARSGPFSRLMAVESWLGKGSFLESRERALALLSRLEGWWRDALLASQVAEVPSLRAHMIGEPAGGDIPPEVIAAFLIRIQEAAARVEANVTPRLALEQLIGTMPYASGGYGARTA